MQGRPATHDNDRGTAINHVTRYHVTEAHINTPADVPSHFIFDDSPCPGDNCLRVHIYVFTDDDELDAYVKQRTAADQRTRDRAIYLATIRAANVYDGRPRTVPVTLDDIIVDAEHILSGWADADSGRVRDGGTPTA